MRIKLLLQEDGYLYPSTMGNPYEVTNEDYELYSSGRGAFKLDGDTPIIELKDEATIKEIELKEIIQKRASEYPSRDEQFDMQYWDMKNGTTVWFDTITAIKEKYPKPE